MSQPEWMSLQAWAEKKFDPVPHRNTLQRWATDGSIVPRPWKRGNEYMVSPTARHIDEPVPGKRLVDRVRNGLTSA